MADKPICSIDGCGNKAKARGLCGMHWLRQRRHGDPLKGSKQLLGNNCSVAGCDRKPHARWKNDKPVCKMHWNRLYTSGSIELREKAFHSWAHCSVAGCDKDARSPNSGMCEMHYGRLRRNGTLDAAVKEVTPKLRAHGYLTIAAQGHPVSDSNGQAYVHRKVLFDAIGEGVHQCHWCKSEIEWLVKCNRKLVVDHLDGKKDNNDRANLVPACNKCNANRGLFQAWVMRHKDDPFLWQMYTSAKARAA
jgi:hypothetical protein